MSAYGSCSLSLRERCSKAVLSIGCLQLLDPEWRPWSFVSSFSLSPSLLICLPSYYSDRELQLGSWLTHPCWRDAVATSVSASEQSCCTDHSAIWNSSGFCRTSSRGFLWQWLAYRCRCEGGPCCKRWTRKEPRRASSSPLDLGVTVKPPKRPTRMVIETPLMLSFVARMAGRGLRDT